MNWRGRPLNSYEVVVNSIAATTTRTGLTVHAELGPGSYPAGAQVTDAEMDALPLTRHDWHADWNCTLRTEPQTRPPGRAGYLRLGALGPHRPGPCAMGPVPHRPARRRRRASPIHLSLAGRAVITIVRFRFGTTITALARLWTVSASTIKTAQDHAWPLLVQAGYPTEAAGPRLRTLSDLTAYASDHGITFTPKQTGYLCTVPRFIHSAPSRVAIGRRHRKPRQS